MAREGVTVALSGDGGDEVFAGYRRYRWHCVEERVRRMMPDGLRRLLFGMAGALYPKLDWAPRPLRAKATLEELARDSIEAYFRIAHEQLPFQTAAPPAKIASPAATVAIAAPDRKPEQPTSTPDVAGSYLIGHTNPDDQAAVTGTANSDGAIPYATGPATVSPIATEQARWE